MTIPPDVQEALKCVRLYRSSCLHHEDCAVVLARALREALARLEEERVPEVVVRALRLMESERMAVGFYETEVRKCCETEPKEPHDPECLVLHALDALAASQSPAEPRSDK